MVARHSESHSTLATISASAASVSVVRCSNCDRIASAATATCRPTRSTRASARTNARSAAIAPRGCSAGDARIAAANWCGGRSGRPTGCCATRPRQSGSSRRRAARRRRGFVDAMPRGPSRRGLVPPFIAMDVLRAANAREAAGHSVIHLEVGQPGTPAPDAVLDAARRALGDERIGYTDALGIAPLREAIARHYGEQYGVAVDPGEIVVTTGSSAAFQLAFLAAFEAGDRVSAGGAGLSGLSQHPDGARAGAGADRGRAERALPAEPGIARPMAGRHRRADRRQPRQPDRHDDPRRRTGAARRLVPRPRHPARLGRDLSRHHL